MRRPRTIVTVAAAALALVACSAGADKPGATPTTPAPSSAPGTQVDVNEIEFALAPSVSTASAGAVTFVAHNAGTIEHEMVVMRTDIPVDKLPVKASESAVDEEGPGIKGMGEVEDVAPGTSKTVTLTLPAGHYVLLCNVTGHYASGMRAAFTVT